MYVAADDEDAHATVDSLTQGYVVCPSDQRFLLLFTFLKKYHKKKKIMVFFSSCNSVKYHSELLNYVDLPVLDIHGKYKQAKRTATFYEFTNMKQGVLLCTDVAARGLDIPYVDWIVQYDPPDDPRDYIHRCVALHATAVVDCVVASRVFLPLTSYLLLLPCLVLFAARLRLVCVACYSVGRTARGATGSGKALMFLTPEVCARPPCSPATNAPDALSSLFPCVVQELGFLKYLKAAKVTMNEFEFPQRKIANVQAQLEELVSKNFYLNRSAKEAYRSYILAYASHSLKNMFNVHKLDLQAVAKGFGFVNPPRINLNLKMTGKRNVRRGGGGGVGRGGGKKQQYTKGGGHAFSASNPYGRKAKGDRRQFVM